MTAFQTICAFVCILISLFFISPAVADQDGYVDDEELETVSTLQTLALSLDRVEEKLRLYRTQLKSEAAQTSLDELHKNIAAAITEKEKLDLTFEEIATGVDLEAFGEKLQSQFDWTKEFRDLLSPILGELRSITNRPREVERLKREVSYFQARIPIIEKSLTRLSQIRTDVAYLAHTPQGKALTLRLQDLEKEWLEKLQQTRSSLAASEHQLSEKLAERKSLVNSVQTLFAIFFRSRGRNLAAAIFIFIVFLFGARLMYRLISRISPWHREKKKRKFIIRLADVLYYIMTVVGAILSALIALYIFEDWVLLALSFILIFGFIWAARKGLPSFWQQAQLMLNLGSVREGEIVIVSGLPWMVETINVYTYLTNPLLKGGRKRVPLRDLVEMRSRRRADEEPWFPCREGDWVILKDGVRGKVVCQTPEMVEIVKLGGSHIIYPTLEFLSHTPLNISQGFRLHITFGVDYAHQALVTNEIIALMRQYIEKGLYDHGHKQDLLNLNVEFHTAGSSSLDLQVLADFSGQAAAKYCFLERLINKLAVDACNSHNWVIPFTQITLHQA